jgi:hypothetical protein
MKLKLPTLILALAGLVFLIIPLLSISKSVKIKKNGVLTEGIVSGSRSNSKGGLSQVTVSFKLTDGSDAAGTASKRQHVSKGEKVTFWYDPADPQKIDFGDTIGYNMRGVIIGGLFFILGLYFFIKYSFRDRSDKNLIRSGKKISAEFVSVSRNERYRMGDNNPWVIKCKWTDNNNNQEYYFVSKDYTIDPGPYLGGRYHLDVYIDSADPGKYYMDTSFMPEGNNTIG